MKFLICPVLFNQGLLMSNEKKILAIDFGLKRVGLSLSDYNRKMAFPFKTIRYKDDINLADKIRYISEEEDVDFVVLGNPLHLSGDNSEISDRVVQFYDKFKIRNPELAIVLFDERMTSVRAGHILEEQGISPSRNKEKLDSIAASILLEDYLDKIGNKNT